MAVGAVMQQQMQIHQSIAADGRPEFLNQLSIKLADLLCWEFHSIHKRHATAQVDGRCDQRLFHRKRHVTVASDPLLITQCLVQAAAKTDPDVFDRVVMINVQITNRFDLQIEKAVPSKQRQHVIEEANARGDLILATAIEIDRKLDLSFGGVASNRCGSGHGFATGLIQYVASTSVDVLVCSVDFSRLKFSKQSTNM